jgi:ketopantoate reductase
MDFIILGAGAVGAVVGTLLEHSGHRVRYWARAGQTQPTTPFGVERDGGRRIESRPIEWIDASTSPMPDSDWVVVCVRTEQLSAALDQVVRELGADRAVAIATVTIDGALPAARAAGLRGAVLAFHVSFGAGFAPHAAREATWFPFTPPSTVSAEGQPAMRSAARELARTLADAGLPCRSILDMGGMMRLMVLGNMALLPSWELCHWDIALLARDRSLRLATAVAMHQTVRRFAPERGVARAIALALPRAAYAVLLRVLPWLMGARARKLWLIHGPKVSEQTRYVLRILLERAAREGTPLDAMAQLMARWEASLETPQPCAAPELRASRRI